MLKKVFPLFLILLLVLGLGYWMQKKESTYSPSLQNIKGKMELEDIEYLDGEGGKLNWKLKAKLATQIGEDIILQNVQFVYLDKQEIKILSPEGKINNKTSVITLYPKVKISRGDMLVFCDKLIFDKEKDRVDFLEGFKLTKGKYLAIDGERAYLNLKDNSFHVLGKVRSLWFP